MSALFGDWETSYALLPRYLQALKSANPGTVVLFNNKDIGSTENEQFNRVFWAFGPSIKGFKYCRPILSIDGTHLYGKYKGVLLIALGVDANEGIFPLAFQVVPRDENGVLNEVVLHRHVRAYLFYLLGTVLFPDKSGNKVQLIYFPLLIDVDKLDEISWGSGVLAYLYRNLCSASKKKVSQIGGCLLLLQFWSWERLTIGRPKILRSQVQLGDDEDVAYYPMGTQMRHRLDPLGCKWLRCDFRYNDHRLGLSIFRDLLDTMTESRFTWVPYTSSVLEYLAPICSEDPTEWLVIVPLICFELAEWHFPERVVRQFGWHQKIPIFCDTNRKLHLIDRRGDGKKDYSTLQVVTLWTNRKKNVVEPGEVYSGSMDYNDSYLLWYRKITRLRVSPPKEMTKPDYEDHHYYHPTAADYEALTQMGIQNYKYSTQLLKDMPDNASLSFIKTVQSMQKMNLDTLERTQQGHRIQQEPTHSTETTQEETTQEETTQEDTQRRYDFRNIGTRHQRTPTEDEEMPGSSSRVQKTKKKRTQR